LVCSLENSDVKEGIIIGEGGLLTVGKASSVSRATVESFGARPGKHKANQRGGVEAKQDLTDRGTNLKKGTTI